MADLINALPGIELPVGEVLNRLATMWDSGPSTSLTEFRASQMNVVLHFGLDVTETEARDRFDTLIRFAQRYPSRIIVLCPSKTSEAGGMVSKLFSQCYIGKSHREMCCCEALLLGYKSDNYGHLANQVSIWLEGDLPTYHWFSAVPAQRIEKYFDNLLVGVRRCIYDSSIEREDLGALKWPDSSRVHDLAKARLLPVRQAIGQFMSGYPIESLCQGLQTVTIRHSESMQGEATRLLQWIKDCLVDCHKSESWPVEGAEYLIIECDALGDDSSLSLELAYDDERFFKWRKFKNGSLGQIEAYLGKAQEKILTQVKPLAPEQALAEAFFF